MKIDKAIDKIKKLNRLNSQRQVAEVLGLSETNFSNMKKRGTLQYSILDWAIHENVSIDALFYEDCERDRSLVMENKPDQGQAVRMLLDIFESSDEKAKEAIYKNLEYFSSAVARSKTDRRKVIDPNWPTEKERRRAIGENSVKG